MTVRPAKTQISLGIHPVWSESSLSAWRKLGSLATHWAHSEDWSDWADAQADLSLRWVHTHFAGFVMSWISLSSIFLQVPWSCRNFHFTCQNNQDICTFCKSCEYFDQNVVTMVQVICSARRIQNLPGPPRSVRCTIWLVFRVHLFNLLPGHISFIVIWSWSNFYGYSLPTTDSSRAVVCYWWKYGYLVLVYCLGSLPRNRMDRLIDRLMTLTVLTGP